MTGHTETASLPLTQTGRLELSSARAHRLVREIIAFAGGFTGVSLWAGFFGIQPTWSLPIALATGLLFARPRRALLAPLVALTATGAVWLAAWMGAPTVLGAAAVVGALASWRHQRRLDMVNGALAGVAGLGAGMLTVSLLNLPVLAETAICGLLAALAMVPSALNWRPRPLVPSRRHIALTLKEDYRPPALRGREVYDRLRTQKPDAETLDGLAEVAMWVYDLSRGLQTLDEELENVDESDLIDRIEFLRLEADECSDEFTRERQLATARHLQSLLGHAEQLRLERERSESLQNYAVAYLEEARMGLALARTLPGEAAPGRLGEVLDRLRSHAQESDTRRRTAREVELS